MSSSAQNNCAMMYWPFLCWKERHTAHKVLPLCFGHLLALQFDFLVFLGEKVTRSFVFALPLFLFFPFLPCSSLQRKPQGPQSPSYLLSFLFFFHECCQKNSLIFFFPNQISLLFFFPDQNFVSSLKNHPEDRLRGTL